LIFQRRARRDDVNGHMVVQDNLDRLNDYVSAFIGKEAWGSNNIVVGNTSVSVTHGLNASQVAIVASPQIDPVGRWWISGKTPNGFTINISAALGTNIAFDWIARAF